MSVTIKKVKVNFSWLRVSGRFSPSLSFVHVLVLDTKISSGLELQLSCVLDDVQRLFCCHNPYSPVSSPPLPAHFPLTQLASLAQGVAGRPRHPSVTPEGGSQGQLRVIHPSACPRSVLSYVTAQTSPGRRPGARPPGQMSQPPQVSSL